jgi:ABC-type Na+ transport system ATPase subunit NatA
MLIVQVAHLTKEYLTGAQLEVDDVSITNEQGEVVSIVGHNGAGKNKVDQSSGRHS